MGRPRKAFTKKQLKKLAKRSLAERMEVDLEEEIFEARVKVTGWLEDFSQKTRENFLRKAFHEKIPAD